MPAPTVDNLIYCRVRVSCGHRPEATAPTEAAAETVAERNEVGGVDLAGRRKPPTHTEILRFRSE